MEQCIEPVVSLDLVRLGGQVLGEWSEGSGLAESAVGSVVVVVLFEFAKHDCGVSLVDDQDAVEEFVADGVDEAFGDRVGSGCSYRRRDDAGINGGEHGVERCGELGVAVADQEAEAAPGVVEVHEDVSGLLSQSCSGGVGGDAEDVDAAGGVFDDEGDVEPAQGDGVEVVEQVAGEDRVCLHS